MTKQEMFGVIREVYPGLDDVHVKECMELLLSDAKSLANWNRYSVQEGRAKLQIGRYDGENHVYSGVHIIPKS